VTQPYPYEDRYYTATYERRLDACRDALTAIRDNAGYALHDIERGRIPRLRSILDEAQRLARDIEALTAIKELKGVCDSAKAADQ
jgi:hypothetical protein